jgi:hypothetical protein
LWTRCATRSLKGACGVAGTYACVVVAAAMPPARALKRTATRDSEEPYTEETSRNQFFVRLLTADDADWWERDPEAGDFYLSAFLSAARQVTATLAKRAAGYEQ